MKRNTQIAYNRILDEMKEVEEVAGLVSQDDSEYILLMTAIAQEASKRANTCAMRLAEMVNF